MTSKCMSPRRTTTARWAALLAAGTALGCGAVELRGGGHATGGGCDEGAPATPLIVDWPSSDRAAFDAQLRRGLVVASVRDCKLEILAACAAVGSYAYVATSLKRQHEELRDGVDVHKHLPVNAEGLTALLRDHASLAVDRAVVGTLVSSRPSVTHADLQGDCARATHLVRSAAVGAFRLARETSSGVGLEASLAGASAGWASAANQAVLSQDGDPAACARASRNDRGPPDGCGALTGIEIIPLAPDCPPGSSWTGWTCHAAPVEQMVHIPGGTFLMGSYDEFWLQLPHWVDVLPFSIDVTEVTVDAYRECVKRGACAMPNTDNRCNWPAKGSHPMNCVTWSQARDYCVAVGKRLPTDQEWEFAARGTDGRLFPWGNDRRPVCPDTHGCDGKGSACNIYDWFHTCPVGSTPADQSPFGVFDMAGNVEEYTSDPLCPTWDPFCSQRYAEHGLRGGSTVARDRASMSAPIFNGFRCAKTDGP